MHEIIKSVNLEDDVLVPGVSAPRKEILILQQKWKILHSAVWCCYNIKTITIDTL